MAKADTLTDDTRALLMAAAMAARENNDSLWAMDAENRHWFVGTEVIGNHSHVLIQVKRGQDIREAHLGTDAFTPDAAQAAITKLDGELQ